MKQRDANRTSRTLLCLLQNRHHVLHRMRIYHTFDVRCFDSAGISQAAGSTRELGPRGRHDEVELIYAIEEILRSEGPARVDES